MRLFLALDIADDIRQRITRFIEGMQPFAPDARWVKAESLHVTLKFVGEQPESALDPMKKVIETIRTEVGEIRFRGWGFFPTAKSARVFWIGMESGPELATLADAIDAQMPALGIAQEKRPFSPHLTLARSPGGSGAPHRRGGDKPNRVFRLVQEKLAALPVTEFGAMTPREFFLYQSHLSPKGSTYTKLMRFPLK